MAAPKRTWSRPRVAPLTDAGGRADAPDVPVQNGTLPQPSITLN
jgi:hypothetical protein